MAAIIPKEMRFRFNLWRQSRHLAGLSALNGFLTIDFSHFTPLLDAPNCCGKPTARIYGIASNFGPMTR